MKYSDRWSHSGGAWTQRTESLPGHSACRASFIRRITSLALLICAACAISLTPSRVVAQPPLELIVIPDSDRAAETPAADSVEADSRHSDHADTPLRQLDILGLIQAAQEAPGQASRPVPVSVPSPERPRSVDVPPFVIGPRTWPSLVCEASVFDHHPLYYEQPNLERFGYSHGAIQPVIAAAHFAGSTLALPIKMVILPVWSNVRTPCPF